MAYLSGYSKYKVLTLTGGASGAQTAFQLKLAVSYEAAMQGDFDDLRFTRADGTTLIDACAEVIVTDTSATVWVEFPTTPANTVEQIYRMYYGNASAANYWDGDATFECFDGFEDDGKIAVNKTTKGTIYDTTRYAMCPFTIKLHDGTLFSVFGEGDAHACPNDYDVKWTKSINDGSTWSTPATITTHPDSSTDARNPCVLEFDDSGTWTILVYYDMQTTTTAYTKCKKSTDGGSSWGSEISVSPTSKRFVYGTGVVMSNDKLLIPTYDIGAVYVEISDDGGDTWTEYSIGSGTGYTETSVIEKTTNGHLYALIRKNSVAAMYKSVSTDYGETWSAITDAGISGTSVGAPATLLRLDDGDILVSWEKSDADFRVARSIDEGTSWNTDGSLSAYYDASMPASSGYPCSVQIDDTHVYTSFYVQYSATHADLHGNTVDISNHWIKTGTPTLDYSSSILRIHGTDNTDHRLTSSKCFAAPCAMESRSKIDFAGTNYAQLGFGLYEYPIVSGVEFAVFDMWSSGDSQSRIQNANGTNRVTINSSNMDSYFVNKIKWKSGEIKYVNTGGTTTHTTYIPTASIPIIIGGHGYSNGAFDMYLDWIFVRKYVDNPPTYAFGAEESVPTGHPTMRRWGGIPGMQYTGRRSW